MRIFNLDSFGFILAFHDADFVVGSAALALSQNAEDVYKRQAVPIRHLALVSDRSGGYSGKSTLPTKE